MSITKLDLTHHLADTLGLTAKESAPLINALFDTIRTTLASGEDVKLSSFGNFALREKRARPGRNPMTGEPFEITARRVVTFRAGPAVGERCNEVNVLPAFGKARALMPATYP